MNHIENIFVQLKEAFAKLVDEHGMADEEVQVTARPLSPGEAIGNPEADDYPLLKGKERMMEATFRGSRGQAFTDMYGNWSGKLSELVRMDLSNNFRRALFVASLNAVMNYLGLVERTAHCRDEGPARCGEECAQMIAREHPSARITIIGHQPRLLEQLSKRFKVNMVDMDPDNIGKESFGVIISGPEMTAQFLRQADVVLVTGTTLVNDTIGQFLELNSTTIFYGVTIAGAAKLLGLQRFCPFGL